MRKSDYSSEEAYRAAKKKERLRYYGQYKSQIEKSRKRFSKYEDRLILLHTIPDTELCKFLNRSLRAIHVRRARLKSKED